MKSKIFLLIRGLVEQSYKNRLEIKICFQETSHTARTVPISSPIEQAQKRVGNSLPLQNENFNDWDRFRENWQEFLTILIRGCQYFYFFIFFYLLQNIKSYIIKNSKNKN